MKFIIIVCATFFARVKPVSTSANPACMNMTRKPVNSVHMMLIETRLWPAKSATSSRVGLPAVFAVTSLIPPVAVPAGSGFDGGRRRGRGRDGWLVLGEHPAADGQQTGDDQGCGDSPRPCANDRSQVLHGHALLRAALRASPRKKIAPTFGRHYPPATSLSRGAVRQQGACRGIVINSNANLATGAPTIDAQRISTSEDLLMPRAGSTRVPSLSTLCSEET